MGKGDSGEPPFFFCMFPKRGSERNNKAVGGMAASAGTVLAAFPSVIFPCDVLMGSPLLDLRC